MLRFARENLWVIVICAVAIYYFANGVNEALRIGQRSRGQSVYILCCHDVIYFTLGGSLLRTSQEWNWQTASRCNIYAGRAATQPSFIPL
jgi:hypothetical protein